MKIKLSWWKKNVDELKSAYREMQAAKVGRLARLKGTVEEVVPPLPESADTDPPLTAQEKEALGQWMGEAMVYFAEAEGPQELLDRFVEFFDGMHHAEFVFSDDTHIPVQPPPTHMTPELEAKLQRAHDRLRGIAEARARRGVTP